ncbi:tRNA (adenosine(37)-N6)-threonylcarbamoyltransferase complex dimerization subunit type 1 TsaB [Thiomicrorhabdus aquaedulcis]|uniref:tRNA (adenosine(37)-N6)-threonylcarbamoyltransferase complex dimerization subunit type 1 TsaB n=1 Tax=Thiomicrorhabdus aquaedulcis TaxID=2211106 RepID=UPI000FDC4569|nr:tRNA (adenosine(37)-N6)-threonylcarbamoyltransferase complex dimerization subunit type 1 TsaB [Thiomicrorhabdus aquaedulcis]
MKPQNNVTVPSFTLLAVETSTEACSAALYFDGSYYEVFERQPQKHAHRILEMVDEVLNQAGISGFNVDYLAFGEGPGAFTGTRIAAGVIQGLALGWQKPVINISSLEAIAEATVKQVAAALVTTNLTLSEQTITWCALMDARMQEVYYLQGQYHPHSGLWQVQDAQLLPPDCALEQIKVLNQEHYVHQGLLIGVGDVKSSYPGLVNAFKSWHDALPSALSVVRLAQVKLADTTYRDSLSDHDVPMPVYLRNHVADTIIERALKNQLNTR